MTKRRIIAQLTLALYLKTYCKINIKCITKKLIPGTFQSFNSYKSFLTSADLKSGGTRFHTAYTLNNK